MNVQQLRFYKRLVAVAARQRRESAEFHVLWRARTQDNENIAKTRYEFEA